MSASPIRVPLRTVRYVLTPKHEHDLDRERAARHFLRELCKLEQFIRIDKRGTGLSDRPVNMATLEERTDDIRA